MAIPENDRDLFSAHEVLQMMPLWDKGGTYSNFIRKNNWVKKFLPNAWNEKYKTINDKKTVTIHKNKIINILEPLFKKIQLRYMKNHRTTEVISDTVIRFHPRDARVWIKSEFGRRLSQFNIPLDSVFYSR